MENEREQGSRSYKRSLGEYAKRVWQLLLDYLVLYIIFDSLKNYTILKAHGQRPGVHTMEDQLETGGKK